MVNAPPRNHDANDDVKELVNWQAGDVMRTLNSYDIAHGDEPPLLEDAIFRSGLPRQIMIDILLRFHGLFSMVFDGGEERMEGIRFLERRVNHIEYMLGSLKKRGEFFRTQEALMQRGIVILDLMKRTLEGIRDE